MARLTSGVDEVKVLLEILKRIPYDRKISSTELLNMLNNSGISIIRRRLQRYLKAIVDNDCGVECDDSEKPFGYRKIRTVAGLETLSLDSNAKLLLNLAREHLKYQIPTEVSTSLDYLFEEGREAASSNSPTDRWIDKVAVVSSSIPMIPPKILPRIFNTVSEGLFEGKQLEITYRKIDGELKKVLVNPLGLVQQAVRLYLVCKYVSSDSIRHLALHRMEQVELTTFVAEKPANFNLKRYVKEHHFNYGKGKQIELVIEFTNAITARNLQETPFNRTQKIEEIKPGLYQLRVQMEDSVLLDGWIATWKEEGQFTKIEKTEIEQ